MKEMAVPGGAIRDDQILDGLKVGYLKKCGFWQTLNHYRETGERDKLYTTYMWITLIGYAPLFVTSAAGPFFTGRSLEELTLVLLNPVSAIQVAVKFAGIWFSVGIHAKLMDLTKKDFLKCVPDDKRKKVDEIMAKAVGRANFITYLPIYSNFMTIFTWNIFPILRSDFVRDVLGIGVFGKAKMHNKILGFWFPVDVDVSPWTELVYFYELYVCTWAAFVITLYECTLIQLTALLIGHMRALTYLLSEHKTSGGHSKADTEYLLSCITEHKKMLNTAFVVWQLLVYQTEVIVTFSEAFVRIKYVLRGAPRYNEPLLEHPTFARAVEDMRNLFDLIVTLQLTSGTAILIMSIFNFFMGSNDGDLPQQFKFFIYLMYALLEVSLYCYVGSELETVSDGIGFAAYSSEWYDMGTSYRKAMQMIMIRSRYPSALKAAWYPVNYDCLTTILQLAYSTSMLMYRVTNE